MCLVGRSILEGKADAINSGLSAAQVAVHFLHDGQSYCAVCQIGPDVPPNLATLAAARLGQRCQIVQEIWQL